MTVMAKLYLPKKTYWLSTLWNLQKGPHVETGALQVESSLDEVMLN
jgi:hypothetical protein